MDLQSDPKIEQDVVEDLPMSEGQVIDSPGDSSVSSPDDFLDGDKPSDNHTYFKILRGIRSYIGWDHTDMNTPSSAENSPSFIPLTEPVGKISLKMPIDD